MHREGTIFLSLICATKGRTQDLERLMESLCNQICSNWELILIDQNEDDLISGIIARHNSQFSINHIKVPVSSLAKCRNIGLQNVRGQWVGFPDDDCWVPPNFIGDLINTINGNKTFDGLFVNWQDPMQSPPKNMFEFENGMMHFNEGFRLVSSICMYFNYSKIKAINGFNEKFGLGKDTIVKAGEDQELLLRMLSNNMKIMKHQGLTIYHAIESRPWNRAMKMRIMGQGACDIYFYKKYFGTVRASKTIGYWLLAMFYNLIRFNKKSFLWYYYKFSGSISYSSKL